MLLIMGYSACTILIIKTLPRRGFVFQELENCMRSRIAKIHFNEGYEVDGNRVLWDINILRKWTPTTGSNKNDFQAICKSSFLESSGFTTQEFTFNNTIKETAFRLYC